MILYKNPCGYQILSNHFYYPQNFLSPLLMLIYIYILFYKKQSLNDRLKTLFYIKNVIIDSIEVLKTIDNVALADLLSLIMRILK